ncbi:MAG: ATP-binding cassette domain-containing protein [Bacilli bacterium]|nr:ATP-binding cassette domain-containing protein [Bacilli bacterium]
MELELIEYPYKDQKLSFTLKEKEINGISGSHLEEIVEIIKRDFRHRKINHKHIKEEDWKEIKNKIIVVKEWLEDTIHEDSLYDVMIEYMKVHEIYPRNLKKKIKDSLRIVGLPDTLLDRNIYSLSTSEQKLVQMAMSLLSNPEMMILEEPFKVLDLKNRKKIMMVLRKIKDQYKKTIVLVSNEEEMLLKETDHLIIFKNNRVLIEDKTLDAYRRVEFLKKHKVEVPKIIEFSYLVQKNKKVKIDYHKDIRDIIKDIYKHV